MSKGHQRNNLPHREEKKLVVSVYVPPCAPDMPGAGYWPAFMSARLKDAYPGASIAVRTGRGLPAAYAKGFRSDLAARIVQEIKADVPIALAEFIESGHKSYLP
jgi:hypothetical protein